MSDEPPAKASEIDDLLNRLQAAHRSLLDAVSELPPAQFARENVDGESAKGILERATDEVNLYYGPLVARAVSLPQPPGLEAADFASLAEAKASLQRAHRHLSKLLHDLTEKDLSRPTRLESTAEYNLRQVLETAVAHYRLRADQIKERKRGISRKGS